MLQNPIRGLTVSHLQFADDTIVFVKPELEGITNLKSILKIVEVISGLKVNWGKCGIVSIHVEESFLSSLADSLGCKVEK